MMLINRDKDDFLHINNNFLFHIRWQVHLPIQYFQR
jgi:hypothetical protein